jgi:hypothetical protein
VLSPPARVRGDEGLRDGDVIRGLPDTAGVSIGAFRFVTFCG